MEHSFAQLTPKQIQAITDTLVRKATHHINETNLHTQSLRAMTVFFEALHASPKDLQSFYATVTILPSAYQQIESGVRVKGDIEKADDIAAFS